jgi:hypothetical protein
MIPIMKFFQSSYNALLNVVALHRYLGQQITVPFILVKDLQKKKKA